MSHHVFEPSQWPLFEFKAFKIDDTRHYLLFGYDLLICDSASIQILGEDLVHYCREPEKELPALKFSFKDYMMAYGELKRVRCTHVTRSTGWISWTHSLPLQHFH